MPSVDDLLQPSLGGTERRSGTTIYSSTVGYLSAFFGGPVGAAIVATFNAHRLDRLRYDWWILPLALAVTLGYVLWLVQGGGAAWLERMLGGRTSVVTSALGLALFAATHRLHRTHYRSMELLGLDPPSGSVVGIFAILLGWSSLIAATCLVAP